MKPFVISSLALLIASTGVMLAAGELQSGLPVGEKVGPFEVKDITGPNKGKSLCYR
jgi:hypothetical protein